MFFLFVIKVQRYELFFEWQNSHRPLYNILDVKRYKDMSHAEGEEREPSQEDGAEVEGMGGVVSELRRTYPIITL